ncbi:hypothetical protein HRR83_003606 [Exophiala dermatitidis]|uniref:Uncharacterized protein n=2 Tax=Exophiala dermatitidis TaxID=5970 RepID=H6BSP7_EXODN|nr:uncharacterized protein HMPREF1120_01593 [Exophiala dermatitidis NIH/UT8656]KAJ4522429.1 hypothetical protein HRR74_003014 [Exophiala dermatitidis]EHY53399.1 hypothetical protein HMPREF1120_01593 [Exophiala dermatitidis NIH/UT8656]KAJ4529754.1 hypothetical protein HRR73_000782 [Exophiala dermatitidis]KAJ4543079.1 hypothetical protein HRR77_005339 [Exophiala dermatitidis]KAJ4543580.1 hypothetical protein HRR76_001647 [Exophiala dermatitidis]
MDPLPNTQKEQPAKWLENSVQRAECSSTGGKPWWYHLAESRMPDLCKEANRLLKEQYRLEAELGEKTTTEQKWSRIGTQLREQKPAVFESLDRLERHVKIWTVCDKDVISQLFEGAVTETERLNVLLGNNSNDLTSPTLDLRQYNASSSCSPSPSQESLRRTSNGDCYNTDDSVEFQVEKRPGKAGLKKRRQKANRKRRAAEAAAAAAAEANESVAPVPAPGANDG